MMTNQIVAYSACLLFIVMQAAWGQLIQGTNKLFNTIHDENDKRPYRAFVLFNALSKEIPCRICQ